MAKRRKVKQPWHMGTYHVTSRRITAAARADPSVRCWRCRLTLAESRARWGNHVIWHSGHLIPNQPGSSMAPECSHCNIVESNLRRQQKPHRRSPLAW